MTREEKSGSTAGPENGRLAGREYMGRSTGSYPVYHDGMQSEPARRRRQDIYVRPADHRVNQTRRRTSPGTGNRRGSSLEKPYRDEEKRTGFWALLLIVFTALLILLGLLMLPQLTGIHIAGFPAIAFVNGSVVLYDDQTVGSYLAARSYLNRNTFCDGIIVDGIDLSGMTMEEARNRVTDAGNVTGGQFSYQISINGETWTIDSEMVSMHRNTDEILAKAWAVGRSNTSTLRGTKTTPFQERVTRAAQVKSSPISYSTSISYDRERVRQLVNAIAAQVNVEPVNATVASFDVGSKTFSFNQDISGNTVDAEGLYNQILSNLELGIREATLNVQTQTQLAAVTKAELMNNFCRVSNYSTKTTSNKNRNTNIRLAAEAINGMVVMPGEVFSFNNATGQRTEAKGYKPAAAISGGATSDEIGGGVCQVSSTLFNAVARANLEIVSRSPHAWPSSYVSEGMDATVNWPSLDFKWRNNGEWPVYIVSWYSDQRVYVELYGYGLGDGVTIDLESVKVKSMEAPRDIKEIQNTSLPRGTREVTVKKRNGSVWETYQVWYRGGKEFKRELLCTSTYKAYQETIEYN